METKDIVLLAVTLLILGEVSYLLAKLPRTNTKTKKRMVLVDTSVLMDGRIVGIAATGFVGGTLVIPRSVVGELQFLADNADADKRTRARAGLDVISELQAMKDVDVEILQDGSRAHEGVDERLLKLAKQYAAVICTIDYNLNKVAVVEGIQVLNINELAQGLRMAYLPGEKFFVELIQKGQDSHQAVGHLSDGTMVVVEQSSALIGQTVEVEAIRSLQTAAGKMMFARRVAAKPIRTQTREPRVVQKSMKPSGRQPEATREAAKPVSQPMRDTVSSERPSSQNQHHQFRPNNTPDKKPQSRRPRRRIDREAVLIDLVDKQ